MKGKGRNMSPPKNPMDEIQPIVEEAFRKRQERLTKIVQSVYQKVVQGAFSMEGERLAVYLWRFASLNEADKSALTRLMHEVGFREVEIDGVFLVWKFLFRIAERR